MYIHLSVSYLHLSSFSLYSSQFFLQSCPCLLSLCLFYFLFFLLTMFSFLLRNSPIFPPPLLFTFISLHLFLYFYCSLLHPLSDIFSLNLTFLHHFPFSISLFISSFPLFAITSLVMIICPKSHVYLCIPSYSTSPLPIVFLPFLFLSFLSSSSCLLSAFPVSLFFLFSGHD